MKLGTLADLLKAQLSGHADVEITGAAGIHEAGQGQITFISDRRYMKDLEQCRAAAVLVPQDAPETNAAVLRVKNPRLAFARVLELLYVKPSRPSGISDKASIGRDTSLGQDCSLHAFVVIGDGAKIGNRVIIHPGAHIGSDSVIGDDSVIHANVTIEPGISIGKRVIIHGGTVIGSDGFSFVTDAGRHHKIPQVGGVVIEDDVEIGANCAIDRAMLGNTTIKKGTKIDNLVHVAHNVTIGENCLLAGQVGIAGSTSLGNYVVFAGQVGVGDHLKIGDRVMAGGKSVITQDVEAGQMIAGFYSMPIREWLKVQAVLPRLPELKKTVAHLEKEMRDSKEKRK
jgi:UDP-3-O-[3-hydroxymyristoyl] glucosamine N-acyltransferase